MSRTVPSRFVLIYPVMVSLGLTLRVETIQFQGASALRHREGYSSPCAANSSTKTTLPSGVWAENQRAFPLDRLKMRPGPLSQCQMQMLAWRRDADVQTWGRVEAQKWGRVEAWRRRGVEAWRRGGVEASRSFK